MKKVNKKEVAREASSLIVRMSRRGFEVGELVALARELRGRVRTARLQALEERLQAIEAEYLKCYPPEIRDRPVWRFE